MIYIAGKLNGDACEYNKNVHKMVKYGEIVRNMGCAVSLPCNDVIHGIICGNHEYKDYFENNLEILKRCDAVALVQDNWMGSKGVAEEIRIAGKLDISILVDLDEVHDFVYETGVKVKPVGNASGTIKVQKVG